MDQRGSGDHDGILVQKVARIRVREAELEWRMRNMRRVPAAHETVLGLPEPQGLSALVKLYLVVSGS